MPIETDRVPPDTRLTIHYLAHSAWLVETARRFLVLDYGILPAREERDAALLDAGCLDLASPWPDWLGSTSKPVFVFASHRHRDHYHPGLHQWLANLPGQGHVFVLGLDPSDSGPAIPDPPERTLLVRPDESHLVGDASLRTFASTDQGVALLAQFPELTIYHGGDLACWTNEALYADRHAQSLEDIRSHLAASGQHVDVAFCPVCTSDGWQEPPVAEGALALLDILRPHLFFPMHGHTFEPLYVRFAGLCKQRLPEYTGQIRCASQPGERFEEVLDV